ncbi:MAG: DsrE family protein [Deltaproteobacteria bacterium]|nr:DsrE family protein [Candidatus Zymogenaceae bacterium]
MSAPDKLCVIWSSGDPDVARSMVFMYTHNSKRLGWWREVKLVVWGASAVLMLEDESLHQYIEPMKEDGVILQACRACADMHGVTEKLEALGIEVIYMGEPLTEMLKSDEWAVLTF